MDCKYLLSESGWRVGRGHSIALHPGVQRMTESCSGERSFSYRTEALWLLCGWKEEGSGGDTERGIKNDGIRGGAWVEVWPGRTVGYSAPLRGSLKEV